MKCQILFSALNKKNISICYLLKNLPWVLSIKTVSYCFLGWGRICVFVFCCCFFFVLFCFCFCFCSSFKVGDCQGRNYWISKYLYFKGSISLQNRHFITQEGFNKMIYGINTIIKCGIWQPVKFHLVSRSWNEMIFYRISELMLPALIQRYDKKSFHFWSSSKTRD